MATLPLNTTKKHYFGQIGSTKLGSRRDDHQEGKKVGHSSLAFKKLAIQIWPPVLPRTLQKVFSRGWCDGFDSDFRVNLWSNSSDFSLDQDEHFSQLEPGTSTLVPH